MIESTPSLAGQLTEALDLGSDAEGRAADLFRQFLARGTYSRPLALSFIHVAQGRYGDSWEVRRLATLMLQEHLLGLPVGRLSEFRVVLGHLGLEVGGDGTMPARVLQEGYSRRDLAGFVREFRRRLARPRCVVRPRGKTPITCEDVREFVLQSRQECKLALGRVMFRPEDVVARVQQCVTQTAAMPVATTDDVIRNDAAVELPEYEEAILRLLLSTPTAYWVADATPSKLNSLVEFPVGTVVLVIKPPGSHHEFEIKRVGRRGDHPISVRSHVPPSHRLDGGSMLSALEWDARETAALGRLYRPIHGEPAPISRIVRILGNSHVPGPERERPIAEYLTHPKVYGAGYDAMRKAMAIVVECFRQERGDVVPPIPGDYGLTAQLIALAGPAQATICGSSSFRLDLVAKYLSADGPDEYFRRGLQIEYQNLEAKRLADDVLDEVLGVYDPPDVKYQQHDHYVAAALAAPRNRARANAVYLSLLKQIGMMWGTLLALRGYTFGESFVARNVGLRTIWSQGEWCVRLIFQDHDNLVLPDRSQAEFWPMTALPHTSLDDLYINGRDGLNNPEHELDSLRRIYRVDEALREMGRKRLRSALKHAYLKTQTAMQFDPRVKSRFDERFIERLRDWDAVARIYLARNGSPTATNWKSRVQKFLQKRGYDSNSIADHCRALEEHGKFVERHSFLYRARSPARPAGGESRDTVTKHRDQSPSS
jgi:hypothetical protein